MLSNVIMGVRRKKSCFAIRCFFFFFLFRTSLSLRENCWQLKLIIVILNFIRMNVTYSIIHVSVLCVFFPQCSALNVLFLIILFFRGRRRFLFFSTCFGCSHCVVPHLLCVAFALLENRLN